MSIAKAKISTSMRMRILVADLQINENDVYGEAIGVYLAFAIDKMVDYHSTVCVWHTTRELIANTMRRQAIQMTWDYAEANPLSTSAGSFSSMLSWIVKCVELLPTTGSATVRQYDAQSDNGLRNIMVSTDPPYYDMLKP